MKSENAIEREMVYVECRVKCGVVVGECKWGVKADQEKSGSGRMGVI